VDWVLLIDFLIAAVIDPSTTQARYMPLIK
jgi:hypothetical protein